MTDSINIPKKKGFSTVADILDKYKSNKGSGVLPSRFTEDKYISREFQKYGYDLARELGDLKNKSLYIKLAKENPRALLESARNFVKDAYNVKSSAKLFMWKLKKLKSEKDLVKTKDVQV